MIPDIDWKGLALPFAYLAVLGGALMTFSTIYRKRKAGMFYRTYQTYCSQELTNNSAKRKPGALVRPAPAARRLPIPAAHEPRGGQRQQRRQVPQDP